MVYYMKGKFKRIRFFLIIIICSSVPALSTYLFYDNLVEADIFSSTLIFENVDQLGGDFYTEKQKLFTTLGPNNFSLVFRREKNPFNQFSCFSFQKPHSVQETSILRC